MASVIRALAVLVATMAVVLQVSNSTVHKVGDSAGWTTMGNVNYKEWAATESFRVGDVIKFTYNAQFHNVLRVTHAMYRSCNATVPLESYSTGNDSIAIKTKGHHFFICGVPGHCQAGQKVDIHVLNVSVAVTPSALPAPTPTTAAKTPAPSPSTAAPHKFVKGQFALLGLFTVATLAFVVSG
ncbi:mavicyanin-like [Argentina anserina]|uniref:mavicyanin-like n=1 Tax=Argentina anserina TaxID=57926 RepID=UPI0021768EB4|nr:mavicyanin-like [Potentilla anserina]